jgi:hypothetical protein
MRQQKLSMIPKNGRRFSDKIMRRQKLSMICEKRAPQNMSQNSERMAVP